MKNILSLGPESSISQNIRKNLFWKVLRKFSKMILFFFLSGLKSVPGSPGLHYFDSCTFLLDSVSDQYMTQEISDKVVSYKPFMLKYCPNRFKTQKTCDKAIKSYLLAFKFVPGLLLVG